MERLCPLLAFLYIQHVYMCISVRVLEVHEGLVMYNHMLTGLYPAWAWTQDLDPGRARILSKWQGLVHMEVINSRLLA